MFNAKTTTILAATALAAAVAFVAAGPSEGSSSLPITACGQTVTTNAVLAQDLTCAGAGIIVGASGITIDLGGHVLKGNGSARGIENPGHDNVTIRNGVVRHFDFGLNIWGADTTKVSKIVSTANTNLGIYVEGGSGLSIMSSTASGNGGHGIAIVANSASVKSSTAAGNGFRGLFVKGDEASVVSFTAVGNKDDGIDVEGNRASVKSSTASGNVMSGVIVIGGKASVTSTKASGNGVSGIHVQGDAATITGNRADGNGFAVADGNGHGVGNVSFTTPPVGRNTAVGNDRPEECLPASLC